MRQINFSIEDRVYAALEKRASEHGYKATSYAKMLFEAAFASRVGVGPDPTIDERIATAVVLHGARKDSAKISQVIQLSEQTVLRIIDAWRRLRLGGAT